MPQGHLSLRRLSEQLTLQKQYRRTIDAAFADSPYSSQCCCADTLHRFCKKEHDWGWKKFMELNKVLEGFTVSNTLVIKAQVQVIRYRFFCGPCQDVSIEQVKSQRPKAIHQVSVFVSNDASRQNEHKLGVHPLL